MPKEAEYIRGLEEASAPVEGFQRKITNRRLRLAERAIARLKLEGKSVDDTPEQRLQRIDTENKNRWIERDEWSNGLFHDALKQIDSLPEHMRADAKAAWNASSRTASGSEFSGFIGNIKAGRSSLFKGVSHPELGAGARLQAEAIEARRANISDRVTAGHEAFVAADKRMVDELKSLGVTPNAVGRYESLASVSSPAVRPGETEAMRQVRQIVSPQGMSESPVSTIPESGIRQIELKPVTAPVTPNVVKTTELTPQSSATLRSSLRQEDITPESVSGNAIKGSDAPEMRNQELMDFQVAMRNANPGISTRDVAIAFDEHANSTGSPLLSPLEKRLLESQRKTISNVVESQDVTKATTPRLTAEEKAHAVAMAKEGNVATAVPIETTPQPVLSGVRPTSAERADVAAKALVANQMSAPALKGEHLETFTKLKDVLDQRFVTEHDPAARMQIAKMLIAGESKPVKRAMREYLQAIKADAVPAVKPVAATPTAGVTLKAVKGNREIGSSEQGAYDLTHGDRSVRVYRDPDNGYWYADSPGHFSDNVVGFNKKELVRDAEKIVARHHGNQSAASAARLEKQAAATPSVAAKPETVNYDALNGYLANKGSIHAEASMNKFNTENGLPPLNDAEKTYLREFAKHSKGGGQLDRKAMAKAKTAAEAVVGKPASGVSAGANGAVGAPTLERAKWNMDIEVSGPPVAAHMLSHDGKSVRVYRDPDSGAWHVDKGGAERNNPQVAITEAELMANGGKLVAEHGEPAAAPAGAIVNPAKGDRQRAGDDGYFKGDKGTYTGKTEEHGGGVFYELKMKEGPQSGKTVLVRDHAERQAEIATKQQEHVDQQAAFARLNKMQVDAVKPSGAKVTKELTKAQLKRIRSLESKGYDDAYTADDGTPVMVLRDKKIYVEVLRNGNYRPASDRASTAATGTVESIAPNPVTEASTGGITSFTTKTPGTQEADKLAKHIVEQMGRNGLAVGHPAFAARYRDMLPVERKNLLTALVDKGLLPKTYAKTRSNFPTAYGLEQEVIGMAKAAEQAHKGVATNRHIPFTESEFYKKATGGGTQQSSAPATTITKMGGDIKVDSPSGIDDAKIGLDEMLKSRDTDGGKAIVAGRVLWAYDGNPQMQQELVKHLDDVAPGVRKYIQENHADTPKELSSLFGKTVTAKPDESALESAYSVAKLKLDAIGPEPRRPSPEKRVFPRGRAGVNPELIASHDADTKAYQSWRRKYSALKKTEVETSNALYRAKATRESQAKNESSGTIKAIENNPSPQKFSEKKSAINPNDAGFPYDTEAARVGMDKRGYAEYGEHKVKVVPHPNGGVDDKATFAVQHLLSDGQGGANRTILPTEYKSIEEAQNAALNELNARVSGKSAATAAPVASPEPVIPKYTRQGVKESPSDRESRRVQIADLENRLRPLEKKYSDVSSREAKTPRGHTKIKAKLRQEADSLGTQVGELRNAQRKLTREQDLQIIEDILENPKSHEHYLKSLAEFHDQKRHHYREMTDSRQKSYALGRDGSESAIRNAEKHSLESDKYSNELIDRIKAKLPADKLNKDELQSAAEDVYRDFGDKTDMNRAVEASVARRLSARKDYKNQDIDNLTFLDDAQRAALKAELTQAKEAGGPDWHTKLDPIIKKGRTANEEASKLNTARVNADNEAKAKQAEITAANALKESRAKNAEVLSGPRYIESVTKRAGQLKGTVEKIIPKGPITDSMERVLEREKLSDTWEIVKEVVKGDKGKMETVFKAVHIPTGLRAVTTGSSKNAKQFLTLLSDQGIDLSKYKTADSLPRDVVNAVSRVKRTWENDDLYHLNADEKIAAMKRVERPDPGLKADMVLSADDLGVGGAKKHGVTSAKINDKLKTLAEEVPEFAYNPVLTVTDEGRLLFRNGFRYEFKPEAFNLHPSELTPGKTIGINLADMGIARASEHEVVVKSLKHAGFESVTQSKSGEIKAIKSKGDKPTIISQSKPEQWQATGVESKPVQELLDKIRWVQPGQ